MKKMEVKTKNSSWGIDKLHSTATDCTGPRHHFGISTRAPRGTRSKRLEARDDMIYGDFKDDEEGRDVQLKIDNEVDEDRWIFDLHCWNMY